MVEDIESVFRTLNIDFASESADLPGLFNAGGRIFRRFRSAAAMCDNADSAFLRKQGVKPACHQNSSCTHRKDPHNNQHCCVFGIVLFPWMKRNRLLSFIEIVQLCHLHHIKRCSQQADQQRKEHPGGNKENRQHPPDCCRKWNNLNERKAQHKEDHDDCHKDYAQHKNKQHVLFQIILPVLRHQFH